MYHYLERERIRRIKEASGELVEPFRSVVRIAMQRVREGTIDRLNRQTVTLWDHKNSREYVITDSSVDELGGVVISTRFLDVGLFIEAVRLKIAKNQDKWIFSIQLPRNPDLVDKVSLESLGGCNSKEVNKLADVLLRSTRKQ